MLVTARKKITSEVLEVRHLTDVTVAIRMERGGIKFEPGQYVRIGIENSPEIRDYSVYSGNGKEYIEILVRCVENGLVSRQLCGLKVGGRVEIGGPYGHFKLTEEMRAHPLLLVATGTGIAPYRSFVESYSHLDYRLIHGSRYLKEGYEKEGYGNHFFHCVSREAGGDFNGRVTDYLKTVEFEPDTNAFLCGNCDMIYDAFDRLQERGLPTAQIHTEVYF